MTNTTINPSSVRKMHKQAVTTLASATGQRREVVESDVRELWSALINANEAKKTLQTLNSKYNKIVDGKGDKEYGAKCLAACFSIINISEETDLVQK